ncbi:hypothetical protein [Clostridium sp. 19966]|nr:hypothetical protein [Clostridium sp. 19966]
MPFYYAMCFSGISIILTVMFYYIYKEINSLVHVDNINRIEQQ